MKVFENDLIDRRELTIRAINLLGLKTKPSHITQNVHEVMISCPFHKDRTPSFGLDLDNGRGHCFACGWSGSIESLYKDLTGQSLKAVLGLTKDIFSNFALNSKRFNFHNFNEDTNLKSVYVNLDSSLLVPALSNKSCSDYISSRGISTAVVRSMNMQYAENVTINNTIFSRRLLIPVVEDGRLISYEGRRIFPEDPDPKVLYPRNCTVNTLYDIDNLNKDQPLYACEGLMDLAVLRSCDTFNNSTSIFGANLTHRQIELFREFSSVIYIPDEDEAGYKTVQQLKDSGLTNIFILKLPKVVNNATIKDIGDLPKVGATVQDLVDRRWLNYIKKLN